MKVKLTYFRVLTGKYYTSGEYETNKDQLFHIWDEVQQMRIDGKLPGLVADSKEWVILINVPDHPLDHPKLLMWYATELTDERYPPKI